MLEFIPRKQVVAHLESGWRLLPNHRYIPHDYAILMQKVESPEPLTSEQIQAIFADFSPPKHDERRCKRGHYLSGDNIYTRGNAVCCRTCKRLNQAAYMKRQRAMECA